MKLKFLIAMFSITFSAMSQQSYLSVADSLASVGKQNDAIKLLEDIEPKSEKILLKLAKLQQQVEKNDEALENYIKVLNKNPERVLTALDYGELLMKSGKPEQADSLFTLLSKKYPNNAGFVYRAGLAKEMKKDSLAIDRFFQAVKLDSTHQGAIYKTALYHLKKQSPHEAISLCQTGLKHNPDNPSLLSILGQAYFKTYQYPECIEPFEALVRMGKGSEFIFEKLAKSYRAVSNYDKALEYYKKLLKINNLNATVHAIMGMIYLRQEKFDKAQTHLAFVVLIKDRPLDREYLNLGLGYKGMEKFEKAFESFGKALDENPRNERALLERAIAADAYFEDQQAVLNLYNTYLERFGEKGKEEMISVAKYRVSELKSEIHLAK